MGDNAGGRAGYWFPLALLGFGLLAMLGWESVPTGQDFGWFAYAPLSDGMYFGPDFYESDTSVVVEQNSVSLTRFEPGPYLMRDFPWSVLVTATLVATMAWYGWRARRAGEPVGTYVMLAVGGGLAVLLAYVATGMATVTADPSGMVTSVGLPLLGLGAMTGAWAYLRLGPWRRAAGMISAAALLIGTGTVLGAWSPGLLEPVIITAGLLALARFERSRLLAIVAVLVLAAMVVFPAGTLSMLAPAMVVLAAVIVVLVRQGGSPEPAA
jgi:hypothetical protein